MALPLGICLSNLYVHICDCCTGKMLQLHACLVRSGRSSMERRPLFRCLGASTSSREFVLSILEMQSRKGSKREWPMRLSHCTWTGRLRWIGVGPPLWRPRTNGYGTEGARRDVMPRSGRCYPRDSLNAVAHGFGVLQGAGRGLRVRRRESNVLQGVALSTILVDVLLGRVTV